MATHQAAFKKQGSPVALLLQLGIQDSGVKMCTYKLNETKFICTNKLTFLTPPLSLTTMTSRGESFQPCQQRRKFIPTRPQPQVATFNLASVSPLNLISISKKTKTKTKKKMLKLKGEVSQLQLLNMSISSYDIPFIACLKITK